MLEWAKRGYNEEKEGYFSKHNSSYWENKNYLGIGPSAHSYNGESRSWNISNNKNYIEIISENKRTLIKIVDVLSRDIKQTSNKVLFYIYDNGKVDKRVIIE